MTCASASSSEVARWPGRAHAGMRDLEHVRLHVGDQLSEGIRLKRFAADQDERIIVDEDDWDEILFGIERKILVERDIR